MTHNAIKERDPTRNAASALEALAERHRGKRGKLYRWVSTRIRMDEHDRIQDQCLAEPANINYMIKYLDLAYYMHRNFLKAKYVGLPKSSPLRILDIGCGPGHFLLACEFFGHTALGLDVPSPFIKSLNAAFGVNTVDFVIEPLKPLPALGRFDLVTAFNVQFDMVNEVRFGREQWEFMLSDILNNLVAPGGRLHIGLSQFGNEWIFGSAFSDMVSSFDGHFDPRKRVMSFAT